jgi:hypothetical protein
MFTVDIEKLRQPVWWHVQNKKEVESGRKKSINRKKKCE